MKESISCVSELPLADIEGKLGDVPLHQYELPDGTKEAPVILCFMHHKFTAMISMLTLYHIHTPLPIRAGTIIDIGLERFACAEILFDSSNVNFDTPELVALNLHSTRPNVLHGSDDSQGIAHLAADSVFRCDPELQGTCM